MEEAISDPTGFQAMLTDDCWQHIVLHHPEMQPFKQLVVETIRQPDGIYSGKRDPSRRIYRKNMSMFPGSEVRSTFWFLSAAWTDMWQRHTLQGTRFAC